MATSTPTDSKTRLPVTARTASLTPVHWTALGLAAITGVLHLYLYATEDWLPFLLAGAGFIGAIGLFFLLRNYRRPIYLAGVLFTAAQIVGYVLFPMGPLWLGLLDKGVQVTLVVTLGYLFVAGDGRSAPVERGSIARD